MLAESIPLMLHGLLASAAFFFVLWVIQVIRKDAGVVDIGWTTGVGLLPIYYAFHAGGWMPRRVLVPALVAVWAFRLVLYILVDRVLRSGEDSRYQRLRDHWGPRAHFHFLFFFVSQSLLVVLFSLPFIPIVHNPRAGFGLFEMLGGALWVLSVGGESLADRQLARFRRNPANKGRTCRNGFWKYSRHPNYFFEWLHWWAYVLFAIGVPNGWLTLVGPVAMFLFLYRITGIPFTEMQAVASRGDDYRQYQRTTSAFFPWFPKKG